MSGPKSSRYTLTLQQQLMLLERLRQEQERLIQEERRRNKAEIVKQNSRQLKQSVSDLQAMLRKIEQEAAKFSSSAPDFSATQSLCQRALDSISQAEKLGAGNTMEQIDHSSSTVLDLICAVQMESQRVRDYANKQDVIIRDEATKGFLSGFELSFANLGKKLATKDKTQDEQKITSIYLYKIQAEMSKLISMTISEDQQRKLQELKQRANEIDSPDYLENFLSISVIPFVKECTEYNRLYQRQGENYEQLRLRYEHLATDLGYQVESIPFSAQAVTILLEKIRDLEAEELQKRAEAYICQCVDEAMAEMNYSIIGNRKVTKKNGHQFRNVLYKFDEGTAVNVTYSSDGQITMELGGVSHADRTPTEAEGCSLEEDMRVFCDDFYEIEKKLKAKGIEAKRLSHLPAEAQFAQLINVSDYQMTDEIGEYTAKADKRRRAGATTSLLHREG